MSKQLLFCPGPVNMTQSVKRAILNSEIGHRESDFSSLLRSINNKLLAIYGQKNDKKYYPVVISGSGTAANETVLSSVVGDKSILIISNGEFGERLYDISKLHNRKTFTIKFDWAQRMDLKRIETYLRTHAIDFVAMVHHETSTGMLNPIYDVGKLCKKYKCSFIVDTVSSAGAEIIDIEKANITYCTSSTGKALASFPGTSFVISKKEAIEKLNEKKAKTAYLNLYKFYYYSKNYLQTPNTPAVPLFFALHQALANIVRVGISEKHEVILAKAKKLRKSMQRMGLKFLLNEKDMSCVLTTVLLPDYIDIETLKMRLMVRNIVIYNGKGPFKDKVFQVGNIGDISYKMIKFFLDTLKKSLDEVRKESFNSRIQIKGDDIFIPTINKPISIPSFSHFYQRFLSRSH